MIRSTLQLEYSMFDHVRIDARPEHVGEENGEPGDPKISITLRHDDEDKSRWHIWLRVDIDNETEPRRPYDIGVHSFGTFTLSDPDLTDDKAARLVSVNGGSLLYSSTRELVALVTGRGPWERYWLPTMDLRTVPFSVIPDAPAEAEQLN